MLRLKQVCLFPLFTKLINHPPWWLPPPRFLKTIFRPTLCSPSVGSRFLTTFSDLADHLLRALEHLPLPLTILDSLPRTNLVSHVHPIFFSGELILNLLGLDVNVLDVEGNNLIQAFLLGLDDIERYFDQNTEKGGDHRKELVRVDLNDKGSGPVVAKLEAGTCYPSLLSS